MFPPAQHNVDVPPFAGSSLVPRLATPAPPVDQRTLGDMYLRILGFEAELRRMAQDNTLMSQENARMARDNAQMTQDIARLRDESVKGVAEVKGQVGGLRTDLQSIRMEWIASGANDRSQLWDLHKNVAQLGQRVTNLTDNVQK